MLLGTLGVAVPQHGAYDRILTVSVDRTRALWRMVRDVPPLVGPDSTRSATFREAAALPRIAAMASTSSTSHRSMGPTRRKLEASKMAPMLNRMRPSATSLRKLSVVMFSWEIGSSAEGPMTTPTRR